MPPSRITVHIGLPKTGTTTLQRHFYFNKTALQAAGIDYAWDMCRMDGGKSAAHHCIAKYCDDYESADHDDLLRGHFARHGQTAHEVLLSSEDFQMLSSRGIQRFRKFNTAHEIRRVVLVIRDEFAFIQSMWAQHVKTGKGYLSLSEYFDNYRKRRRTLTAILRPWIGEGFIPVVLQFEDLATCDDLALGFLRRLYGDVVPNLLWKSRGKANVTPDLVDVCGIRKVLRLIDSVGAGRKLLQRLDGPSHVSMHDFLCRRKILRIFGSSRQYRRDCDYLARQISSLAPFDDFTRD